MAATPVKKPDKIPVPKVIDGELDFVLGGFESRPQQRTIMVIEMNIRM